MSWVHVVYEKPFNEKLKQQISVFCVVDEWATSSIMLLATHKKNRSWFIEIVKIVVYTMEVKFTLNEIITDLMAV